MGTQMFLKQIDFMETKWPLNFYFIIIVMIGFFAFLINESVIKVVFYELFSFLYLFIFLGRDACKIKLTESKIVIKYLYPWYKDITINIDEIIDVDYEKGFYDLFSNKSRGGIFVFTKYCSDRLIFKLKEDNELLYVNVNTRIFHFNRVFKLLKSVLSQSS